MARLICKFTVGDESWYLEWSTTIDAPVSRGMTLEQFHEYYRHQYGESGMRELPERMARVEEKGTSSALEDSIETQIQCNRAGKNETCLSMEQIIDHYCRNPDGERPTGSPPFSVEEIKE